jgi:hypothetical protein
MRRGTPTWGTRQFPKADRAGHFSVLASGYPEDTDSLAIRANARVLGATLRRRQTITYPMGTLNKAYLVSSHGRVAVNGIEIEARDGVAVSAESARDAVDGRICRCHREYASLRVHHDRSDRAGPLARAVCHHLREPCR